MTGLYPGKANSEKCENKGRGAKKSSRSTSTAFGNSSAEPALMKSLKRNFIIYFANGEGDKLVIQFQERYGTIGWVGNK